jgi:hypothetical protein
MVCFNRLFPFTTLKEGQSPERIGWSCPCVLGIIKTKGMEESRFIPGRLDLRNGTAGRWICLVNAWNLQRTHKMGRKKSYTKAEKAEVLAVFNKIAPCTLMELVHIIDRGEHYIRGALTGLKNDGFIYCRQVTERTHVWFPVGFEPKKGYKHVPKDYMPKEPQDTRPVAGPRTHQPGTTEPLVWKGWQTPARPGAMDAFALPSRGF